MWQLLPISLLFLYHIAFRSPDSVFCPGSVYLIDIVDRRRVHYFTPRILQDQLRSLPAVRPLVLIHFSKKKYKNNGSVRPPLTACCAGSPS